jgi:farnesyl-diphosphate farnesyltransferase
MCLKQSATEMLKQTSRTFYISIVRLPPQIREAVMSSYLSLRAIDEIEDHPHLDKQTKINLLNALSVELRQEPSQATLGWPPIFRRHFEELAEVTNRLDEWLALSPRGVARTIHLATAVMARRMAYWVDNEWLISSKRDLDRYTFSVAGAVGVLLSDLWTWYDGTPSRKRDAIGYGRGLQAVNILRNRSEDLKRGVDFFPRGWDRQDFVCYAKTNLSRGDAYVDGFPLGGPAHEFCGGPQALAYATLEALEQGESKLSRSAVIAILGTKGSAVDESTAEEHVILVNERDEPIGVEEKIRAHLTGALHRAFSVFVFNSSCELLLQRRTSTKYHSRGLWSNTACGHPRPGETIELGSRRRLSEEMGFDSQLTRLFHFVYRAELEEGLVEHEYDHVLVGGFDGVPVPNCTEVAEWRWIDLANLRMEVEEHPERYTYWFRISLEQFHEAFEPAQFILAGATTPLPSNA